MMSINQILERIPHRYPFLLVDRVVSIEPKRKISALKNVTIGDHFFVGHYPHQPIMPGVLIIEALAQTAALLMSTVHDIGPGSKQVPLFVGINNARFKHIVVPGDQLYLHIELERAKQGFYKLKALAQVDQEDICTADLTTAIKEDMS